MKAILTISFMVLMALAFSSCGTTNVYANRVARVQKGMTKEDVKELFGKPDFIRFDDYSDMWEYRRFILVEDGWSVVIISFDDRELVNGMDTFFEPSVKVATSHSNVRH